MQASRTTGNGWLKVFNFRRFALTLSVGIMGSTLICDFIVL